MDSSSSSSPNPASEAAVVRPRIQNACEACRAAKLKCQTRGQQGICKRCLEHKRECVYRSGPRTRRPRISRLNQNAPRQPPPPGPSKTFSIDFPVLTPQRDRNDDWEELFKSHESYIDDIIPPSPLIVNPRDANLPSPPASTASGASATSFYGQKPQFNLESAQSLLETFRTMLPFFPVFPLPAEATVGSLSKSSPFVLLAMLAAASGSRSLQGHNLYDEEFRKILGMKFVAGGERSVELLLGLLIYCAWFPFHLRPRSNQARRYLRIATDLVKELELDEDERGLDVERVSIAQVRALLGAFYLMSSFGSAWCQPASIKFSPRLQRCCDILELQAESLDDNVLVAMVRVQRLIEEVGDLRLPRYSPVETEFQAQSVLLGLEAKLREFARNSPTSVASHPAVESIVNFATIFFNTAPILRLPLLKAPVPPSDPTIKPDAARLTVALPMIREYLHSISMSMDRQVQNVTCLDRVRHVQCTILTVRLSFPIPGLRWDHKAARKELKFLEYCDRMCNPKSDSEAQQQDGRAKSGTNTFDACRLILGVVRKKYEDKVAMLEARERELEVEKQRQAQTCPHSNPGSQCPVDGMGMGHGAPGDTGSYIRLGCPMIDGSLDSYIPLWDGSGNSGGPAEASNGIESTMAAHEPIPSMDFPMTMGGSSSGIEAMGYVGLQTPSGQRQSGIQSPAPTACSWMMGGADERAARERRSREEKNVPVFHDLWATMTMGWAENEPNHPMEDSVFMGMR
ncbi:zn 2cys6 transcription factor [Zalerion maritima]|uniref:Zn 2cys6 transcription factor n=1 Tax=Zalerion maritima TaxID=339359 RepID=A0AAD5RY03_9PEZI|nr:zn 2cys6 transcription factor [Zalerion maritima]